MYYVLGDSIAKGVVLNEVRDRYVLLKDSCFSLAEKALGLKFKNLSVFGATIDRGLEVFNKRKDEFEPGSTIFLEFGGNDCNHLWNEIANNPDGEFFPMTPKDKFKEYYRQLIDKCLELKLKPVIINLPPLSYQNFFNYVAKTAGGEAIMKWLGDTKEIFYWQEGYDKIVEELAEEYSLPMVNFRQALLSCGDYDSLMCSDGMHPNEKGHQKLAEALISFFS
ncbi:MAG: SGNH/GDSL hydrolase family protein [Tissierellia bacterium]|nr:SGNH/GDSL hydrolase family protein [Tissierellia bacterium]